MEAKFAFGSLFLIKVLRKLPRTAAFDAHLTDCVAHAILWGPDDPKAPLLSWRHILKIAPLPKPGSLKEILEEAAAYIEQESAEQSARLLAQAEKHGKTVH